jgi:hypothetical protein
VLERLTVGFIVGCFGFLTGIFGWWTLSDVPGLDFGWRSYLHLSYVLGAISFLLGLWRPGKTIDVLGLIGQKVWSLWTEVLAWFGRLR